MTKIYEKTYENGRKKIRFLGIKISYKDNKIKYSPLHTDKTKAPIRIAFYVGKITVQKDIESIILLKN